jgi:hypothetical protein
VPSDLAVRVKKSTRTASTPRPRGASHSSRASPSRSGRSAQVAMPTDVTSGAMRMRGSAAATFRARCTYFGEERNIKVAIGLVDDVRSDSSLHRRIHGIQHRHTPVKMMISDSVP